LSIGKSGVTSLGFEGRGEGIPMGFIFVFQGIDEVDFGDGGIAE